MSITLNNSDFQCLQDQLVNLKTKNYELAEKNRRSQADFEAAKAKICTLQLKLEEQERDFQVTSTTLRREIESVTSTGASSEGKEEDYKTKYKKLLHKAKELQQRYEKSVEIVQQLDTQNKSLGEKLTKLEEENVRLREDADIKQKQIDVVEKEYQERLSKALEEHKLLVNEETLKLNTSLNAITMERDQLKQDVDRLTLEVNNFNSILEVQAEERRIQERKGIQIVKELKRQLASEKNRTETLQKRLENLLSEPPNASNSDLESRSRLSTSSSTNGNSNSSNGNGSRANQDANSVGSWSFVPVKTKSSNQVLNETISLCSIDSEDRETVQQPCDTKSENSSQRVVVSNDETSSKHSLSATNSTGSPIKQNNTPLSIQVENLKQNITSYPSFVSTQMTDDGMLIEEQAALVERLTRLQHDKWMLEEKLSYMEQANSSLTEDLANKSDIIKHYFMDQAVKAIYSNNNDSSSRASFGAPGGGNNNLSGNQVSRRTSIPNNVNQMLSDKSSFIKKGVNFLKEKSQISTNETESICRETTKKMQLMLEETLIKCLKLQENLDFVTSELNKLKA